MTFDLSKASRLDAYNAGSFMAFVDPVTNEPLKDDAGVTQGVTLRGRLSLVGQDHQRRIGAARMTMARGGQEVSITTLEDDTTELLALCTVSWTFTHLDGAEFPCTTENARKLWADPRFRGERERANAWVVTEANFTKR